MGHSNARRTSLASDTILPGVSVAIMVMAIVVLGGWHAHVPAAIQVFPGLIPMQYNSALCFLALGSAGIGLSRRLRWLTVAGGGFASAMGATVVVEYLSGRSFGIDTFFFYPWLQTLSADPGRMALTTAMSFCLIGGALVVLAIRPGAYAVVGITNAIPLSLALTSLIGYAFQITYVLPFSLGAQMALMTALALMAYGTAMLAYAWNHAERGRDGAPRWNAGMGVALLPVFFVAASSVVPGTSWRMLFAGLTFSIAGVAVISFGIHALATMRVAYKGLLLIAVPLILLLAFVGIVVHLRGQSEVAKTGALHAAEVLGVSQSLLTRLTETQSAVRGLAITGDTTFADSYQESARQSAAAAATLRRLVADNPKQSARADSIEQLTIRRNAQSARIVALIEAGDRIQVLDSIRRATGPDTMAAVRTELLAFGEEEAGLGASRRAALDVAWQRLSWLLVAGTAGAILLSCMLALSFSSSVSYRLRQLRDNARGLVAGNVLPPPLLGRDEIAELDRVFHEMADSLYAARSRERAVIDSTSDAIFVKNLQHRYLMVNDATAAFIGRPIADIIGASNEDLIEVETARRIRLQDDAIIASGETTTTEFAAQNRAGVERIYQSTRSPYRDRAGHILGLLGISRDVTEQRRTQELIKTNVLQSAIFNSVNFSSIATDPAGVIQIFNVGAERMLGYTGADVTNRVTAADLSNAQELATRAAVLSVEFNVPIAAGFEALTASASRGIADLFEMTLVRKDGSSFPALLSVTALRDAAGVIIGYLLVGTDNTVRQQAENERRLFEQMLRKKNVELESASRMKSEFLANMSHELRTPLNAIIGFSEVLRDGLIGPLSDQQRGFISDIFGSGRHLLALINDILDLSKVEAGEMRLELEAVSIPALFANSLAVVREKAIVGGIQLTSEGGDAAGSFLADGRKMKQIVFNLLANAVKFSAKGGHVVVRASRVSRAEVALVPPGTVAKVFALPASSYEEFVEISVTDDGIGIAAADLERLFKPFSQVDSGLARRFEGTGLGLVMVKLLIELHGGTVAVRSAEGHGSCFTVWIPARPITTEAMVSPATVARSAMLPADGRTALMVDDDMKSAELIRAQLEAEGFTVVHALSAEDAFELAVRRPPALITLDIMLPNMDGWDFLARLKDVPELQRIPVVIISIVADPQKGFSLGAAAVMQKPISRLELYESLVDLGLVPVDSGNSLTVLVVDDDPKAVELIAVRLIDVASTVLRSYGGADAIDVALKERPDVIVLDLMMPDVNGFDVVEALCRHREARAIPIIVVTAKQLTGRRSCAAAWLCRRHHGEGAIQFRHLSRRGPTRHVRPPLAESGRHLAAILIVDGLSGIARCRRRSLRVCNREQLAQPETATLAAEA